MTDYQQVKELFETKFEELEKRIDERFDSFDKRTDQIIESQNGKNKMLDNRITAVDELHQKQADNHCPRIREIEKNIGKVDIQKLKIETKLNAFKIATAIGSVVLFITLLFDTVADWFKHILTR